MAHKLAGWLRNPCCLGVRNALGRGTETQMVPECNGWLTQRVTLGGSTTLHNSGKNQKGHTNAAASCVTPAAWGLRNASARGKRFRSGLQVGRVATLPLLLGGSPTPHIGGNNQKGHTNGPAGCVTPAAWGVPNASEREKELEVAHKWAGWRHNPWRLRGPQGARQSHKGPTSGYITTAAWGSPM